MNEMVKPEMMHEMLPKGDGEKKPESVDDEAPPVSGVRRSAEPKKPVEHGKTASQLLSEIANAPLRTAETEAKEKAEAQQKLENAFFERGDKMNAAHEAGETLGKNAAEQRAEDSVEERAMRNEYQDLWSEIGPLRKAVADAEDVLRKSFGINDPATALAERAMGGGWSKVKRFFGRLSNADQQAKDRALNTYDAIGKKLSQKQARYDEIHNRLQRADQVQSAMRVKAERGRPEQR